MTVWQTRTRVLPSDLNGRDLTIEAEIREGKRSQFIHDLLQFLFTNLELWIALSVVMSTNLPTQRYHVLHFSNAVNDLLVLLQDVPQLNYTRCALLLACFLLETFSICWWWRRSVSSIPVRRAITWILFVWCEWEMIWDGEEARSVEKSRSSV